MLPRDVYRMCVAGALIVGSRALVLAGEVKEEDVNPDDYDLIVPPDKWQAVTPFLPDTAKINKFGGWRFRVETGKMVKGWYNPVLPRSVYSTRCGTVEHKVPEMVEVDVWPSTVEKYLNECKSKHGVPVCVVDYINNRVYSSRTQELVG